MSKLTKKENFEELYNSLRFKMFYGTAAAYLIRFVLGLIFGLQDSDGIPVVVNSICLIVLISSSIFLFYNRGKLVEITMILIYMVISDIFISGIHFGYSADGDVNIVRDLFAINIMILVSAFMTGRKRTFILTFILLIMYFVMAFIVDSELYKNYLIFMILFTIIGCFIYSMLANLIEKTVKASMDAKVEIEELGMFRQNIIKLIFHDIKVPVGSIIELNRESNTSASQKTVFYAKSIIKHLENVLDVEKLEEAELSPIYTTERISELVKSSVLMIETLASQKNLTIICDECVSAHILCDRDLTVRILLNLLSNAIKYSELGKTITIKTVVINENVEFSIKDEGIGIAEEHQDKIFSKYYMVNPNSSQAIRSSGLGLTFCKLATEAQKGKIEVFSKQGLGSEFRVTLPGVVPEDIVEKCALLISNDFSFSHHEIDILTPICKRISQIPVYRLSEILIEINAIKSKKTLGTNIWIERITNSVYMGDQKYFNELISKVINNTNGD